jgi:RNA polymerase sigma-70 factor (ECF subfamily)
MHDFTRELSSDQMIGLAERILAGDRGAEDDLLRHFSPRIYALLCARTRDREASRDLLHDTLIALMRALRNGQLREPDKLTAFVLGIARNTAQSYIRNGMRRREEPLAEEPTHSYTDTAEDNERRRQLDQALAELDPTDREILRLTLVDGCKPAAICKILRMSSDVVRQRKTRATRKVADFVKNLSASRSQSPGAAQHDIGRSIARE